MGFFDLIEDVVTTPLKVAEGGIGLAIDTYDYLTSSSHDDDDYDDDYDYDRAERRSESERQNKKDRILSDIEAYKKETKRRFKEKYGLEIEFDEADILGIEPSQSSIKRKEAIEQEIDELQELVESAEEQSSSKILKIKRKVPPDTPGIILAVPRQKPIAISLSRKKTVASV